MDAEFWHKRWQDNKIGFHESNVNPLLVEHFDRLEIKKTSRILVPLCGKSHDLIWLASRGYEIIGVELSTLAVEAFFEEHNLTPTISDLGEVSSYKTDSIEILVGDIFNVTETTVGTIHAIYDRAALVALPDTTRFAYSKHLQLITQNATQLLINYEYDQSLMDGPPFSISDSEIIQHYGDNYEIYLLTSQKDLSNQGKLKGQNATEKMWLFQQK